MEFKSMNLQILYIYIIADVDIDLNDINVEFVCCLNSLTFSTSLEPF